MAFVALAAVAVVSTGVSIYEGNKSAGAQREANQLQRQQADLQAARQKRDAIRQSRLAYAQAAQASSNQGATGSSSEAGGLGSIQSQFGSNISFLDKTNYLSDQASDALGRASVFAQHAATFQGIASIATTIFGMSGGGGGHKSGGSGGTFSGGEGSNTLGGSGGGGD